MKNKDLQEEYKLVRKAQKNPESFSKLYDAYFPKIFRYVSWKTGSRLDTEDIVADIFMKVLQKIDTFHPQENATFSSWIFRIARNAVTDYYRQKNKVKTIDLDELPEIESNEFLPDKILKRKELFKVLFQMIQKLPQRQNEIITMRFFGEMKNREIAQTLNIAEKSVSSALFRGLQTLHKNFNKQ